MRVLMIDAMQLSGRLSKKSLAAFAFRCVFAIQNTWRVANASQRSRCLSSRVGQQQMRSDGHGLGNAAKGLPALLAFL
jgi:hypothetical protein